MTHPVAEWGAETAWVISLCGPTVVVMEPFTPDDFKYLMSVPPYQCDHKDLVFQYFGEDHPEDVWDFIDGLILLEKNYVILRKKKEEEKEQSLDLLNFINKKSETLKKWVDDLIMRLETEYESRQSEKYTTRRGSGLGQDDSLSTILGSLHTLKIDVKVMMDALKCNVEVVKGGEEGKGRGEGEKCVLK